MKTTLELHGAQTGNCFRAAIALEEAGLSYTPRIVDLSIGEHLRGEHLALNPAGKVPVLVEKEEGREPFILTQSNAIILHAAAKTPVRLLPGNERDRATAIERFFFFVTDVIAVSHAAFSLRASSAQEGQKILADRALATLETAERYVAQAEFMAGETFSAADIAAYTITRSMKSDLPWSKLPNLLAWFDRIEGRPAVKRGLEAFDRVPARIDPGKDKREEKAR
ncbi:glutathione S-transferase family protein [Lichenifustis flavocetrariae]|uniref:Glutathione S-transferase family protein n=1 Tax=Lichenifustis flavocetrariae TaxID=2949735 RepID=A0AA41ZAS0_9HYPH|nr:glutathione S-transferase family protein [Lichenifustis flavocetrariae]MCW6512447.1 glutathione S-transferase family protein [Lichenifustis flavocetrariae]